MFMCVLLLGIFEERYLSFVVFFNAGGLAKQPCSFLAWFPATFLEVLSLCSSFWKQSKKQEDKARYRTGTLCNQMNNLIEDDLFLLNYLICLTSTYASYMLFLCYFYLFFCFGEFFFFVSQQLHIISAKLFNHICIYKWTLNLS